MKINNLYVINQNKIPAVLVEGGFMDGKKDRPLLTTEEYLNGYAKAVAEGLISFLKLKKKVVAKPVNDFKSYKIKVNTKSLNVRKEPTTDGTKVLAKPINVAEMIQK